MGTETPNKEGSAAAKQTLPSFESSTSETVLDVGQARNDAHADAATSITDDPWFGALPRMPAPAPVPPLQCFRTEDRWGPDGALTLIEMDAYHGGFVRRAVLWGRGASRTRVFKRIKQLHGRGLLPQCVVFIAAMADGGLALGLDSTQEYIAAYQACLAAMRWGMGFISASACDADLMNLAEDLEIGYQVAPYAEDGASC